jgi:hypothetical protein
MLWLWYLQMERSGNVSDAIIIRNLKLCRPYESAEPAAVV